MAQQLYTQTVQDTVRSALRHLEVIDPAEQVQAQEMSDAIATLNKMCRRWEASAIAFSWQDISNPSDPMPCPPETYETIEYNLALRLAPSYHVTPNPVVTTMAAQGLAALRRDRMVEQPLVQTTDTPIGYQTGKYDTLTDTWRR